MKPIRMLLAALALVGLAGCYTSNKPLVAADEAVAPYAKMTFQGEGNDNKPVVFTREADGKTYVTVGDDGTQVKLLLKPVEGDYYVVQLTGPASGDPAAGDQILFGYLHIDVANKTAEAYRTYGEKKDVRPGLTECKDVICIDDLAAYIAYAKEAIAANSKPDTTYAFTVEE